MHFGKKVMMNKLMYFSREGRRTSHEDSNEISLNLADVNSDSNNEIIMFLIIMMMSVPQKAHLACGQLMILL